MPASHFPSRRRNCAGARTPTWSANQPLLAARAGSATLRRNTPTAYSSATVCAGTKTTGTERGCVLANAHNVTVQEPPVPAASVNCAWTIVLQSGAVTLGT